MKKKILAMLLASAMVFSIAGCDTTTADPATTPKATEAGDPAVADPTTPTVTGDKVIRVFTFTEETQGMLDRFLANNPDFGYTFDVNLTGDANDYITKVEMALGTGDAPDLYVADADYSRKFAENEGTASIDDLGIVINESDYYTYTLDYVRVGGKIMGLSHQATPGCMYYRTDYASEYLGIDSPEDMQKAVSTWDGFLDIASKLNTASGGVVKMVAGIDEPKRPFINARTAPWIVNGELNVDEDILLDYLETSKALLDGGYVQVNGNAQWQGPWNDGMKENVFAYFGCTWYLHYTIKPSSVVDYDADNMDNNIGKGSFGKWGMVSGPAGFFWGGTWWFGSKQAANSDKKDAVAAVIKYYTCDDDAMKDYALTSGDFISKKTIVEQIKNDDAFINPFLGGQNHYVAFADAAPMVDVSKNVTKNDNDFNTAVDNMCVNYAVNGMSWDEALTQFKSEIKSTIPGITVN